MSEPTQKALKLPATKPDDLGLPELTMLLVTDLAAVDHHECSVTLIANAVVHAGMSAGELDAADADAHHRLDQMQAALATPSAPTVAEIGQPEPKPAVSRTPAGEYQPAVEQALEADGEAVPDGSTPFEREPMRLGPPAEPAGATPGDPPSGS